MTVPGGIVVEEWFGGWISYRTRHRGDESKNGSIIGANAEKDG